MSDEPDPPPTVVAFPSPQTPPRDAMSERGSMPVEGPPEPSALDLAEAMSERGARPVTPPPAVAGLFTPLPRPEPPPPMPTPVPPPMNRQAVRIIDQAAGGDCHLCGKPSGEKPLLIGYKFSPLINVRISVCLSCLRDLVLSELDRRRKHTERARAAADEEAWLFRARAP